MLRFLAEDLITPLLPLFLGAVGIFLYIDLRFFPIVRLKTLLSTVFRHANAASWRALSVALAGTLGVGNIIGVAYAITKGGAGALFWMWVSALLAMIIKYAETVLVIYKRKPLEDVKNAMPTLKRYVGGAMYVIPHRPIAAAFAVLCIASSFTVGNLLQTNAVSESVNQTVRLSPYLIGAILAVATLFITRRGIGGITSFCSFVIPFLSLSYLLICSVILFRNFAELPSLFSMIFRDAFSLKAFGGGLGGSIMFHAMKAGFSRGLITNEAGAGTAPIAHASAENTDPVKQGFLGIIEVFFDTIVLCTASGLVLLLALKRYPTLEGYSLINTAFGNLFGKTGSYFLMISIFFFVLATLVGWSHYGKCALEFFTRKKGWGSVYLLLFAIFAFLGAIGTAEIFWQLSDITLGLMTLINVSYLLYFRHDIKKITKDFFQNKKQ